MHNLPRYLGNDFAALFGNDFAGIISEITRRTRFGRYTSSTF